MKASSLPTVQTLRTYKYFKFQHLYINWNQDGLDRMLYIGTDQLALCADYVIEHGIRSTVWKFLSSCKGVTSKMPIGYCQTIVLWRIFHPVKFTELPEQCLMLIQFSKNRHLLQAFQQRKHILRGCHLLQ
jgi:hypothetical protein